MPTRRYIAAARLTLPVIFARFYGNLRIIQLGPGDHFPRYANSTARLATRRTVLTTVVAVGKWSAEREGCARESALEQDGEKRTIVPNLKI